MQEMSYVQPRDRSVGQAGAPGSRCKVLDAHPKRLTRSFRPRLLFLPIAFQELELELEVEVVPGVGLAVGAWSPRCPLVSLWPPPPASFEPSSSQT